MRTWRPFSVSCMSMESTSPEFMNRSRFALGVKVPAVVWFRGSGGPVGTPFVVTKAKLKLSTPDLAWQSALLNTRVFMFSCKLKIASPAHQGVASQLDPPLMNCEAGQGTQPGG